MPYPKSKIEPNCNWVTSSIENSRSSFDFGQIVEVKTHYCNVKYGLQGQLD